MNINPPSIIVALRKESVDRNNSFSLNINGPLKVALRKESVDRNVPEEVGNYEEQVALRKESVDRNILHQLLFHQKPTVALRKESVDRNIFLTLTVRNVLSRSPQGERG